MSWVSLGVVLHAVMMDLRCRAARPPPAAWFGYRHGARELYAAGCRRWLAPGEPETFPGEARLWLLPASWRSSIPTGLEVVSVTGAREVYDPEEHIGLDNDGTLSAGLLAAP